MRKREVRAEKFFGMMRELYGDTMSFQETDYRNNRIKIAVKCNIHNVSYKSWPFNLARGKRGCPRCSRNLTVEDFIEKARETHGQKYDYGKVNFINTTTKVTITCPMHGDWDVKPIVHYYEGSGCPTCALENARLNTEYFIKRAKAVHGALYDYSDTHVTKNTDVVKIKCPKHGVFEQPARSHLAGHKCKLCSIDGTKNTMHDFLIMAKRIHGNTYDYSRAVYVNSKTKLTVICKRHGEFYIKPNSHLVQKTGCPRCRESYGERCIANRLSVLGIVFKKEHSLNDSCYRFDFYLPNFNVLIEYHGIQHYKPVERFGGISGLLEVMRRDVSKVKLASEKNIPLIVLDYRDLSSGRLFDKLERELVRLNVISQ